MNYPSSTFRSFTHASPPTPRLYHQVDDPTDESVPMVPALKSTSGKASAQGVVISKRPEGLHFLRTPCSLRSLLPDQAYYTKFGACKSTNSQEPKSSQRLRKVSFDLIKRKVKCASIHILLSESCCTFLKVDTTKSSTPVAAHLLVNKFTMPYTDGTSCRPSAMMRSYGISNQYICLPAPRTELSQVNMKGLRLTHESCEKSWKMPTIEY
eukprot:scaffold8899_cov112-Skeletonema_marinoi.AAC.2